MPLLKRFKELLPSAVPASVDERLIGSVAALGAMFLLALSAVYFHGVMNFTSLIAPMGASAVLLFAAPHSPLAQPWAFVGGHLVSAAVGITCARFIPDVTIAAAVAVGGAILAMQYLRCLHPPGGATALLTVIGGPAIHNLGYGFLLSPLGFDLIALLGLALLLNNLMPGRRYPARAASVAAGAKASTGQELGLDPADLQRALEDMGAYIDVSRDDLNEIYVRAQLHGRRRRMGEIRCRDIMQRDVATVEFGTELEEVWQLLRTDKLKGVPVIDRARHVIGIITIVDFLKRADAREPGNAFTRLLHFIRRTPGLTADKAEVAGQIMTPRPVTAREDEHVLTLVPRFAEHNIHHIPIVDEQDKLVGIVTQSDLMAALDVGAPAVVTPVALARQTAP